MRRVGQSYLSRATRGVRELRFGLRCCYAAAAEESIAFVIGISVYTESPSNMFYRGTAKLTKVRNR